MLRKKSAAALTQPEERQVSPPKALPLDSLSLTSIRAVGCSRDFPSARGTGCDYESRRKGGQGLTRELVVEEDVEESDGHRQGEESRDYGQSTQSSLQSRPAVPPWRVPVSGHEVRHEVMRRSYQQELASGIFAPALLTFKLGRETATTTGIHTLSPSPA